MNEDELSPEDRDTLVRAKFAELAGDFMNSENGRKILDNYINGLDALHKARKPQQGQSQSPENAPLVKQKRRSLLSVSMEQALGLR